MKALIIGGTGFIGSHIARACLAHGIEVRILHRPTSSWLALEDIRDQIEPVLGSLEDPASLKRAVMDCDWVFSSAAYYPNYALHVERQQEVAIHLLQNLISVLQKSSIQRFVYTSTISTIGLAANGQLADEDTPYDFRVNRSTYYRIKYELEQKLRKAIGQELPGIILNPGAVYGDYDVGPSTGRWVIGVMQGQTRLMSDSKINVVDAKDVGHAQVEAARKGKIGERYIIGGTNTTAWRFSQLIASLGGVKPPQLKIPLYMARLGAISSEYIGYYLLHRKRPSIPVALIDVAQYGQHYDCTKAEQELGLTHRPIEETIQRELGWFKRHHYIP